MPSSSGLISVLSHTTPVGRASARSSTGCWKLSSRCRTPSTTPFLAGLDARLVDLDPVAGYDLQGHAGRVEALGPAAHGDFTGESHAVAVVAGAVAAADQLAALGLVVVGLLRCFDAELAAADHGGDHHRWFDRGVFARRRFVLPPEVERHALDDPHGLGRQADQPRSRPAGEQDRQPALQPGGAERPLFLRRVAAAVAGSHPGQAAGHACPAEDHGAVLEHALAPDFQVEALARRVEIGGDHDAAVA